MFSTGSPFVVKEPCSDVQYGYFSKMTGAIDVGFTYNFGMGKSPSPNIHQCIAQLRVFPMCMLAQRQEFLLQGPLIWGP